MIAWTTVHGAVIAVIAGGALGCGRLGFDPHSDAGDTSDAADAPLQFTRCSEESFETGSSDRWSVVNPAWAVTPGNGFGGGAGFSAAPGSEHTVANLDLQGIRAARIELEFRIEEPIAGDFYLQFMSPGWTAYDDLQYSVGIFPRGGDNTEDLISIETPTTSIPRASRPSSALPNIWHHLAVTLGADRSIYVELDRVAYLTTGPDTRVPGPFDVLVGFWNEGSIDTFVVECAR
ncbi:MAG: hypothetical protein JWP01_752 [Myxococcales bacterium]|nr:hypothetical protein [Myxococcales bacterium]